MTFRVCRSARKAANGLMRRPFLAPLSSTADSYCNAGPTIISLATPHRAVNRSDGERYGLAFFCDSNIDWPVSAVPPCVGPDKPPKYPATYYTVYMIRYQQRTYNVFGNDDRNTAE